MTNNKIQAYAGVIENALDEIDTLKADIKAIYEDVKAADFNPKALRKAIANKRRKVDAELDARVEEYSAALLAMPGATYRSVAEQTGISKSKLQRLVPREANGTTNGEADATVSSMAVEQVSAAPAPPANSSPPTLTTAVDTRSVAEVMGEHPEFLRRERTAA